MRKFWGYYDNGIYKVGCHGGTIYVYDQTLYELAKFKDIKYAYNGVFHPTQNLFVAKSTEGSLAVYDLDNLLLLKKIVITRIGAQDEGFAFSSDGVFFYNIEKPTTSTRTQLTIYRTSDFEVEKTYFANDETMFLTSIEVDDEMKICYIGGYVRNTDGVFDYGFIGRFSNGEIVEKKTLDIRSYEYISAYKDWQASGFTNKKFEWSTLKYKYADSIREVSLKSEYQVL